MSYSVVGKPVGRVEGPEKISGRATYTADLLLPGMIWGKVLRSPLPHARILGIDTSRARALPGVLAVLTARDLPELLTGRRLYDMPVLARDRVRFIGEKIAAVAAEDPDVAEEAAGLIEVEYEELPAVFDPLEAVKEGAPILHENFRSYQHLPPDAPDIPNVISHLGYNLGNVEEGFAQSHRIFEHTFRTQWMHHGYLEPHAAVVSLEESGRVHVWASNKVPFRLKDLLADCLQVPQERIVIHLLPIGGDFGGKGAPMDIPLCYHLARRTGRPVKMVMSYTEDLLAGNPRHPAIITLKTGVTREGKLIAREAKAIFNSGAYGAFKPTAHVNLAGASAAQGCYGIPHVKIDSYCVYTNCVPCGHVRAPGEPQMIFAVESQMDMMAAELGVDPCEFRRHNLLRDGDRLPDGTPLEKVRARQTLDTAAREAGWGTGKSGPCIGRGIGMSHRHIGTGDSNAELTLEKDGTISLLVTVPDTGTGSHTILRQVASEVLQVPLENIALRVGDTDRFQTEAGAGASRTTHVAGQATYRAALELKERLLAKAAEELGSPPDQVDLSAGRFADRRSGGRGLSLAELASRSAARGEVLGARHYYNNRGHRALTSFCAQIAEVAVDPETGQVQVLKITSAHDAGTIINPLGHQGQVEGGIIQGFGIAVMEELYSQEGRISTLNLGDYKLPNIQDVPGLRSIVLEEPAGPAPFNGKSIGEGTTSPVLGAVANAVYDAVGVRITQLPITSEKIFRALQEKDSGTEAARGAAPGSSA